MISTQSAGSNVGANLTSVLKKLAATTALFLLVGLRMQQRR